MEKNYQIWHHRRYIANLMEPEKMNIEAELERIDDILDDDDKNYHCWTYRIWFVEHF
jgi:protein farnesyltransferase/geranylgeranyltransferase type-1 subunit alpha